MSDSAAPPRPIAELADTPRTETAARPPRDLSFDGDLVPSKLKAGRRAEHKKITNCDLASECSLASCKIRADDSDDQRTEPQHRCRGKSIVSHLSITFSLVHGVGHRGSGEAGKAQHVRQPEG